jgi:lipopolysaccharide export system permease protein
LTGVHGLPYSRENGGFVRQLHVHGDQFVPLLYRHILGQLLRAFFGVLSVLTVVMIVGGAFQEISDNGLGVFQTLQILPYIIPSLLPFSIPVAVLLTVCIVYGRMSANQEVTAAKAAGIPVLTLLWPALFLGGMLSAGSLMLTDQAIPWSVGNIRRVVALAMEDIVLDMLRTHNELALPRGGMSISVRGVAGRTLQRPIVKLTSAGGQPVTAQAHEAHLGFDPAQGRIILTLHDCHLDVPGRGSFWLSEVTRALPLPGDLNRTKPRHMSIQTLKSKLAEESRKRTTIEEHRAISAGFRLATGDFAGWFTSESVDKPLHDSLAARARLRTEMHSRIAFSSSCFFFVLVGAPLAITQARRQVLTNFLTCFLPIILIYYPVVMLCMTQSKTGIVDPAWAMWMGNLILLVAGLSLFHRCCRH